LAAKKPLKDPAVPDGAVEGVNPADADAYKGFNFDMGTMNHNITCNSCHAGGGAAQFGRETKPLDEVLKEKLGEALFEELESKDWFIRDEALLAKTGIDGDLLGYSDYEVGAGYIGKPGVFNYKRAGVNDTDCFMCHADASQKDKTLHTKAGNADVYPLMPANPRLMVFQGKTSDGETIVISIGLPPKIGEKIGDKEVAQIDSAYFNSVPIEVLDKVYGASIAEDIKAGKEEVRKFYVYPNNANGAAREVARVVYFEHTEPEKNGGEPYVGGGAALLKTTDGKVVYRTFAGFFFKYISTASLMGVDTNQDGVPLAYVRFVKEDGIWKPEVYYQKEEFQNSEVALPILMNRDGEEYTYSVPTAPGTQPTMSQGTKNREWGFVCSYCHMAIPYESGTLNGETTYTWVTRKGTLGLAAEIVKRGDVFSYGLSRDEEGATVEEVQQKFNSGEPINTIKAVKSKIAGLPIGYDVHFEKGLSCLSCHGEGVLSDEEKEYHPIHHNFLKGNDWGGHWDQSLDYNPSLKTCLDCHFNGSRTLAAKTHKSIFATEGNSALHMSEISCEVCHIPFKTHWTFRAFYDVLGYSYNFDNRMMGYIEGQPNATFPLPVEQFGPGFGPFMPIGGYGAPQPFPITVTEGGKDVVVPIYQVDFDPRQAALRTGNINFGIWAVPENSFPWGWVPAIIWNGFRPDTPGGQKFMYRIANPLTLVTWYDKTTGKVLYTREINAALSGTVDSPSAGKKVPAYYWDGSKVYVETINGDKIYDDNGDFLPEINTDAEYEAMKKAIKTVLEKAGVKDPDPVFYIWTAPFSIDHGVLPKEFALGNQGAEAVNGNEISCLACHDAQNGRLPQANMADIEASSLKSAIIKDENGKIKFFDLGRHIITVPVEIPDKALEESVRVFFNYHPDEEKRYDNMAGLKVVWNGQTPKKEDVTRKVLYTTAGDLLVNALTNGIDVYRHLVPIPVESSGIDGIAFALPEGSEGPEKWKMRFEGVKVEVETEKLYGDQVPRRAIVIRLKNELPELLGFEHLAKEIMETAGEDFVPVFTPVILSEYISKLYFNLADLQVSEPGALKISYAKLHKVRVSKKTEDGYEVKYELDKEHFHPESIGVEEAISKGWAYFDPAEKQLLINVKAMAEEVPGEGELAISISRSLEAQVIVPEEIIYKGKKVEDNGAKQIADVEVKMRGAEDYVNADIIVSDGVNDFAIEDVVGDTPVEIAELLDVASEFNLGKVIYGVKVIATSPVELTFTFVDGARLVDPDKAVVIVIKGDVKKKVKPQLSGTNLVAKVNLAELRAEEDGEEVIAILGEEKVVPTASFSGGGGGGGCSMGAPQSTASGLANLGALLTGLLGLFGFRRKRH